MYLSIIYKIIPFLRLMGLNAKEQTLYPTRRRKTLKDSLPGKRILSSLGHLLRYMPDSVGILIPSPLYRLKVKFKVILYLEI